MRDVVKQSGTFNHRPTDRPTPGRRGDWRLGLPCTARDCSVLSRYGRIRCEYTVGLAIADRCQAEDAHSKLYPREQRDILGNNVQSTVIIVRCARCGTTSSSKRPTSSNAVTFLQRVYREFHSHAGLYLMMCRACEVRCQAVSLTSHSGASRDGCN